MVEQHFKTDKLTSPLCISCKWSRTSSSTTAAAELTLMWSLAISRTVSLTTSSVQSWMASSTTLSRNMTKGSPECTSLLCPMYLGNKTSVHFIHIHVAYHFLILNQLVIKFKEWHVSRNLFLCSPYIFYIHQLLPQMYITNQTQLYTQEDPRKCKLPSHKHDCLQPVQLKTLLWPHPGLRGYGFLFWKSGILALLQLKLSFLSTSAETL